MSVRGREDNRLSVDGVLEGMSQFYSPNLHRGYVYHDLALAYARPWDCTDGQYLVQDLVFSVALSLDIRDRWIAQGITAVVIGTIARERMITGTIITRISSTALHNLQFTHRKPATPP